MCVQVKAQQLERGIPPNLLTVEWLIPQSANRSKTEQHNMETTDGKEENVSTVEKTLFPSVQDEHHRPTITSNKTFPCFSSAPDMANVS